MKEYVYVYECEYDYEYINDVVLVTNTSNSAV